MKAAIILLSLFFLMVTFRAQARDFSYSESLVVQSSNKYLELYQYFSKKVIFEELPIRDFLSYQLLKGSCERLDSKIHQIKKARNDFGDQAQSLKSFVDDCSEGVLGLAYIYKKQHS